jgi:hypothetical protein
MLLLLLLLLLLLAGSVSPSCSGGASWRGAIPYFPRGVGLTVLRGLSGLGLAGFLWRVEGVRAGHPLLDKSIRSYISPEHA